MAQLTCAQMGGPCDAVIAGNDEEEIVVNGMKHVEENHPEMVEDITKMNAEEMATWRGGVHQKYEAENQAAA